MNKYKTFGFLLILFQLVFIIETSSSQKIKLSDNHPKKVILLIGDGMGLTEIYAAMNAVTYKLNITRCTNTAVVKTSSADNDITDSAAAGTAIATGSKTNNGYLGVTPDNKPLKSILKIAEENGLSTGLVATADITHATPASFIATIANRDKADEIATQFLKTDVDVFIGGGYNTFTKRPDHKNYIDSLRHNHYQIVTSVAYLDNIHHGKLAGLLYPEHAPKEMDGRGDMLSVSTSKALELLSQNKNGFFIMVEGSQIDWGGHDNDYKYQMTELLDFDKAVGVALDYADKNQETLVIVTADHETGGLTLVESSTDENKMQPNFSTTGHTATPVMLFAYGKGAENFKGFIDNTDIFKLILQSYHFSHSKNKFK